MHQGKRFLLPLHWMEGATGALVSRGGMLERWWSVGLTTSAPQLLFSRAESDGAISTIGQN